MQYDANVGGSVEAAVLRHERQSWELLDTLFSKIPLEVSTSGIMQIVVECSSISVPCNDTGRSYDLGFRCYMAYANSTFAVFNALVVFHSREWRSHRMTLWMERDREPFAQSMRLCLLQPSAAQGSALGSG